MKKIYVLSLLMVFSFTSCETEQVEETEDLTAVSHRYRYKRKKKCTVNTTPELPATVNACTTAKGMDADNSYFDLSISDTSLAGAYGAWCVDFQTSLDAGQCFEADVFSSYEDLPDGKFENPQNFDLVNWVFNQSFIGTTSPSGGEYTYGDVQYAIWVLIDGISFNCSACTFLGDGWSLTKAHEIIDLAMANGEGYEPGDGDSMAVLLVPKDDAVQSVFIPYEIEKECKTKVGSICKRRYKTWRCYRWGCKHDYYKKHKKWKKYGRKKFKCSRGW